MGNKRIRRKEGIPSGVSNLAKTTSFGVGVCTRAKSAALKGSASAAAIDNTGDGCYLHLRSRRLEPLFVKKATKNKCGYKRKDFDENENLRVIKRKDKEEIAFGENEGESGRDDETKNNEEYGDKPRDSFGENDLHFPNRDRESTPSRFIMGKGEISTPSSSNKATIMKQMTTGSVQDFDEFFANAQKQSIQDFINKYNFDIEKEEPCEGRYEWVKMKP